MEKDQMLLNETYNFRYFEMEAKKPPLAIITKEGNVILKYYDACTLKDFFQIISSPAPHPSYEGER